MLSTSAWLAGLLLLIANWIGNCQASASAFLPAATHPRHQFSWSLVELQVFYPNFKSVQKVLHKNKRHVGITIAQACFLKFSDWRRGKNLLYLKIKIGNVLWRLKILKANQRSWYNHFLHQPWGWEWKRKVKLCFSSFFG